MKMKLKIQQLWSYLKIQDNERLIVRVFDNQAGKDMFVIAETGGTGLNIMTADNLSDAIANRPFQLIQQRDNCGKHIIPSVKRLIEDRKLDY